MMLERLGVHCASMFMFVRRSPSLASRSMCPVAIVRTTRLTARDPSSIARDFSGELHGLSGDQVLVELHARMK